MCASERHVHYSVFDSSLSIRIEEADESQACGKWGSGFHRISKAGEGSTAAHRCPVICSILY